MKYSPYSYSKQGLFFDCKRKFKLSYIDKIPVSSENKALEKGNFIHLLLEAEISKSESVHEEIQNYEFKLLNDEDITLCYNIVQTLKDTDYFKNLLSIGESRKSDIHCEKGFSFLEDWIAIDKYINKEDEEYLECIMRGFIDLLILGSSSAVVIDYKTGKAKDMRYQSWEQSELYALWVMSKYSNIKNVKVIYYYIEHDTVNSKIYTRDELTVLRTKFAKRLDKIENEIEFPKNVTKLCTWCDYYKQGICVLTDSEILSI